MDAILIKILATALALSQVMTRQDAVRTEFDATKDRGAVVQLLKDGCKHMRQAFDIEDINVDELIETALSDPQGVTGENKAFRGINFADLHALYREFCAGQTIDKSAADLNEVIAYYNKAVADLPDHKTLKGMKLPGRSVILDVSGAHFAETYEPGHRRIWLSLSDIPPLVQRAFIAAGRLLPLTVPRSVDARRLQLNDVLYVRVREAKDKSPARADLRVRPTVQGAAVVLENKTGRILAMTGGFSYALSPLDRSTQTRRQPGSTFKPLAYLAALSRGLQPNTLVWDTPVTLAPVGGRAVGNPTAYAWSPRNYDRASTGPVTLRRALESSKNQVTAHLLNAIASDPEESLSRVCGIALEAQLYKECVPYYPFVLGAQPVRLVDLAAFYAAIPNEGARPAPYAIEAIEQGGRVVRHAPSLAWIGSGDRVAFYQLRTMLQGVLERGTGQSMRYLAPYVAGKTGTSNNENDAWFVGFTNDVTVAVWVGYDNADGQRRTLGKGQTGAKVALPIFEQIIQAVWLHHAQKTVLGPPSSEVQRNVVALPIDLRTGDRMAGDAPAFAEQIRTDGWGRPLDTQHRIVSREAAYAAARPVDPWLDGDAVPRPERYGLYGRPFGHGPPQEAPPGGWRPYAQPPWWEYEERRRRERRIDPDYPWSFRRLF
jgi:membrane carboxypeptidase/penicillin-binding protein